MNKINPKMIQLARESRAYTQSFLAEQLDIPQGNLSRIENGDIGVKDELLQSICTILNYPKDFFYQTNQICPADTHYRKTITIDQKTKLQAEALMNIYKFNIEEMLRHLDLSVNNIPHISGDYESPEKIAMYLRSYWKVPKGTIQNVSKVFEDNGIIIIQMDFGTDKIDGRTIIADTGHPIIFINKHSSGDRMRTTIAHEGGHVILHVNTIPAFARDEEDEAFRFASEFLMPLEECRYDLADNLTIDKLIDLKRIWKVSMQTILYRAQKQNLITYNRARYLWSQISTRGWKKKEPIDIQKETPTLINRMANMFIDELNYSKEELATLFKLNTDELEERYFNAPTRLRIA